MRFDKSWSWSCTLAIVHDGSSMTTYGVCMGLQLSEFDSLKRYLEGEPHFAERPLFVPIAIANLYIPTTTAMNDQHDNKFFDIQNRMKTTHFIRGPKTEKDVNLLEFASVLTSLGSSSAGVTQLCATQSRIVKFLEGQLSLEMDVPGPYDKLILGTLRERIMFMNQHLEAEKQRNAYIKAATKAQVQMVIHNPPCSQSCSIVLTNADRYTVSQHNETTSTISAWLSSRITRPRSTTEYQYTQPEKAI